MAIQGLNVVLCLNLNNNQKQQAILKYSGADMSFWKLLCLRPGFISTSDFIDRFARCLFVFRSIVFARLLNLGFDFFFKNRLPDTSKNYILYLLLLQVVTIIININIISTYSP